MFFCMWNIYTHIVCENICMFVYVYMDSIGALRALHVMPQAGKHRPSCSIMLQVSSNYAWQLGIILPAKIDMPPAVEIDRHSLQVTHKIFLAGSLKFDSMYPGWVHTIKFEGSCMQVSCLRHTYTLSGQNDSRIYRKWYYRK